MEKCGISRSCIKRDIKSYLDKNATDPKAFEKELSEQRGVESDGVFTSEDFSQLIGNISSVNRFAGQVASGMLEAFDSNGDGKVTMQEWNKRRAQKK